MPDAQPLACRGQRSDRRDHGKHWALARLSPTPRDDNPELATDRDQPHLPIFGALLATAASMRPRVLSRGNPDRMVVCVVRECKMSCERSPRQRPNSVGLRACRVVYVVDCQRAREGAGIRRAPGRSRKRCRSEISHQMMFDLTMGVQDFPTLSSCWVQSNPAGPSRMMRSWS